MTPSRRDTLAASEQHIDVWLAYYNEIADSRLHAEYRALMTEEERGREFRFYFPDDQRRYLVTRAMVRTVLSKYIDVPPADWRFSSNRWGRPQIANLSADECGLCFNISHTKGLIALGITHRRELGVDVENLRTRDVSLEIADRFFAEPEVAELASVPKERQQDRFFEYWTFKESYIKARGMGLSIPLGKFSFHYPSESAVNIAIDPVLGDHANRWSFWQYRPTPDYLMALCAERNARGTPAVQIRKVVPMVSEQLIDIALLKRSEEEPKERPEAASC